MLRGTAFRIPNEYGFVLNTLLNAIEGERFLWNIHGWVIEGGLLPSRFEEIDWVDGKELLSLVARKPEHYPVDLTWVAFDPLDEKAKNDYYRSYREFQQSDARMYLEIVDAVYVRFYAKETTNNETMIRCAEKNGYSDILRITEENDTFWPETYEKRRPEPSKDRT